MPELPVTFPCGSLRLEGRLSMPSGDGPVAGVVVCHPHPRMGGSMDNNVADALCLTLAVASIATLRFNFRGVGASEGEYGDGVEERQDAVAALEFLASQPRMDRDRLGLAGYSFGASVAIPVALDNPLVKAVALVSPPLRGESPDLLRRNSKPKLIIAGDEDDFFPIEVAQGLVAELPEPKELFVVSGADHFWYGREWEMADKAVDFFRQYLGRNIQR